MRKLVRDGEHNIKCQSDRFYNSLILAFFIYSKEKYDLNGVFTICKCTFFLL